MKKLLAYFRQKPARVFYASALVVILAGLLWAIFSIAFYAEIFAQVVRNPDHRMTAEKFTGLNSDGIRSSREASEFPEIGRASCRERV